MNFSSATDGVDHINIYSKGKTELGRLLSNFAHTPFLCEDGSFESVEGYWYWLATKDENLRNLYGFAAKEYGRTVKETDPWYKVVPDFNERIKRAIAIKILTNEQIWVPLEASELPLAHYYEYSGRIIELPKYQWMVDHIENIRQDLKGIKLRGF